MPHTCDPLVNAKFTREDVDIEHVTPPIYKISPAIKDFLFSKQDLEFQSRKCVQHPDNVTTDKRSTPVICQQIALSFELIFRNNPMYYVSNEETLCCLFFDKIKFISENKKMARRLIFYSPFSFFRQCYSVVIFVVVIFQFHPSIIDIRVFHV